MIERMARTMFWQRGGGTWIDAAELTKASFRRHAWELLDEMREPTDEMKEAAAFSSISSSFGGDEGSFDYLSADDAAEVFLKMIDAARAEYSQ
jgi:hypothetical protein